MTGFLCDAVSSGWCVEQVCGSLQNIYTSSFLSKIVRIQVLQHLKTLPHSASFFYFCNNLTRVATLPKHFERNPKIRLNLESLNPCFHETKQTQKEVERFFYNLAEFVFEYFCDRRRILATFAKFSLKLLFVTWSYRYPGTIHVIQLELPFISHTRFLVTTNHCKILPLVPVVIAESR